MKNSSFARSARAFFILVNFTAVFVLPRCEMNRFVVWTTGELQGKVSFFSKLLYQFNLRRACCRWTGRSAVKVNIENLLLCVHVVIETFHLEISRCHFADYVKNCTKVRAARAG